jgi:ABC-type transporter Mla subunit MlaD
MSDQQSGSAQIIAFPARRPAPPADDGHERLRRALEALEAAMAGQRSAVAAWRGALADLGTVMAGLGDSMQRYRGNLDGLADRVASLQYKAVQLERTADAALAVRPE